MVISFVSDNTKAAEVNILTKGQPDYTMIKGRVRTISQVLIVLLCSLFELTDLPVPSQVYDALHWNKVGEL